MFAWNVVNMVSFCSLYTLFKQNYKSDTNLYPNNYEDYITPAFIVYEFK